MTCVCRECIGFDPLDPAETSEAFRQFWITRATEPDSTLDCSVECVAGCATC